MADLDDLATMRIEYDLWLEVVDLLKATGAVSEEDCTTSVSSPPITKGMELFVALRKWGEARRMQGEKIERARRST